MIGLFVDPPYPARPLPGHNGLYCEPQLFNEERRLERFSVAACLILFVFFAFCGIAIAQRTSLVPDQVVINMGVTPLLFLLKQDTAKRALSYDSSWQTVTAPYSDDNLTMFIDRSRAVVRVSLVAVSGPATTSHRSPLCQPAT
jgi:hypothetical protein